MSTTISTSGEHGINGNLNASGTVSATTLSGTNIIVGGADITSALSSVGTFETTVNNIVSGSQVVGLAGAVKTNALIADNNYYSLLCGPSDGSNVRPYGSPLITFTQTPSVGNNAGAVRLSTNIVTLNNTSTDTTQIKGALTCDQSVTVTGALNANNGITIASGKTLNGITTATLGYIDPTSSIQTQLNNRVNLSSAQTIAGAKTFSDQTTFNGGIVINGSEIDNGSLTINGNTTLGKTDLSSTVTLNGQTVMSSFPNIQVDTYQYLKNQMNTIGVSANTIYSTASGLYEYNWISTTVTTSPTLTLPAPSANLLGCELKIFRDPAYNNPVVLTISSGSFIISSAKISPNFTLGTNWYKVFFICLQVPGTPLNYAWVQTYFQ